MKKIILTGGGTAGHVTPNIALLPNLKLEGYKPVYIGDKNGMERELIENQNIPYFGISTGKLRRYFDLKNLTDAFKVVVGIKEAIKIIKREKPNVVFSKGGFVSVPVVIGAYVCKVPVVLHESDISPGLANKISIPFAAAICASFPETLNKLPKDKAIMTGAPIRQFLFNGNAELGLSACGFNSLKPVILVMGGSTGSVKINACLKEALEQLLKSYQIIHICGKGNISKDLNYEGYKQFEYVKNGLENLFAASDVVVSRSGANSIFEFLALKKPNLLIPLSGKVSRGDQILNAESFEKQGFSKVLFEEKLNSKELILQVIDLYNNRHAYIKAMTESNLNNGVTEVINVIKNYSKDKR